MVKLSKLKDAYRNQDIYVIGSGPSLSYIDQSFLKDKPIVCVNGTIEKILQAKYVVAKEPSENIQNLAKAKNAILVTCKNHSGVKGKKNKLLFPDETVIFKPNSQSLMMDMEDCLYTSASTITTAMHFAAYIGAKNIILIGHDCGTLDEKVHVEGYDKSDAVTSEDQYGLWMKMNNVEAETQKVKSILKKKMNVNVYSINPFINFQLEGHKYKSFFQ